MNINTKIIGDILIIYLKGELDHHMSKNIREQIDYIIIRNNIKNIVFDFRNVTFMDSSGIGMIIGRYKTVRKSKGKVGIINASDKLKRIFDISGLFSIIDFFDDEKEAIEKYKGVIL